MNSYWNKRFAEEGLIWGQQSSPTAEHARELFKEHSVQSVLVPGAGYGRNSKALSSFFEVDGLEISPQAIQLGRDWDPDTRFFEGSVLDWAAPKKYDAIYCFDVLHLFLQPERKQLIDFCLQALHPEGLLYFTCFSDKDPNYRIGTRIEEDTYEYMPGKYAHFFTKTDLIQHFSGIRVIETGTVKEKLSYADKRSKEYLLRYIVAATR